MDKTDETMIPLGNIQVLRLKHKNYYLPQLTLKMEFIFYQILKETTNTTCQIQLFQL